MVIIFTDLSMSRVKKALEDNQIPPTDENASMFVKKGSQLYQGDKEVHVTRYYDYLIRPMLSNSINYINLQTDHSPTNCAILPPAL